MKLFTQSLVTLPVAAGMLMASSAANAGILTPPPPESVASGSPTGLATSGVTVCVVDDGAGGETVSLNFFPPPAGVPDCSGAPTTPGIVSAADFGTADINSVQPIGDPNGVFAGLLGGQELLADFALPFFGATPPAGLPLNADLTGVFAFPLVNADSSDASLGVIGEIDTIQALEIESVSLFENAAGNTEAGFNFVVKYYIENPDTGEIEDFHGTLALSQIITSPLSVVLSQVRSPAGLVTAFNLQQNITAKVAPEPSAMMAIAAFAGAGLLARKKRS